MKRLLILLVLLSVLLTSCSLSFVTTTPPGVDCVHTDGDDNGICDSCYDSVIVMIDFYGINDIHGKFKDSDQQVGVDELTTYLKKQQASEEHTVLVSAGDTWQGSSESNLTEGLLFTDWMNSLGFAAMVLGNHEFDWGEASVEANAALAEFPLLAINIYERDTNKPVSYAQPSTTVECGDVTVGIIGAIGDCYSSISSDKTEAIYFKTGSQLTALVKAESERLKEEKGADFIVYLLHDGNENSSAGEKTVSANELAPYYDASLSGGYIDLVFEAHTHQSYVMKDTYGVYHLQGGGDNKGITHAELLINSVTGTKSVREAEYLASSKYASLEDDPIVESLLTKYEGAIAKGEEVLGYNASYKKSSVLCQLIADLYCKIGLETWGDEYNIVLGGAFLKARSPYNLSAGEVTYGEVQMIFPFDNQIVLCAMKGSDLRRVFLDDPNASYYLKLSSYGQSILNAIDANKTYYVVSDTYSSTYSYNKMTEVKRLDEVTFARDLLADYIRDGLMAK